MSSCSWHLVRFLSAGLLTTLLPAQEKQPKTVEELLIENKNLRQQVKTLRSRLAAKPKKEPLKAPRAAQKSDWLLKKYFRVSRLEAKGHKLLVDSYRESMMALTKAKRRLDQVRNPKAAQKIVDKVERSLIRVRRALWKLEKAESKIRARKEKRAP